MDPDVRFSDALEQWLHSDAPKSLGSMNEVFAEKTFAVAIAILMAVSATPLPTGGITLVFQIGAGLMAAQMVLGRRTIWVPKRWCHHEMGRTTTTRTVPFLVRRVRWLEGHSRPRWARLFHQRWFLRLQGLVIVVLAIVASLAPPFTFLDTLPALGAVMIAAAIMLEDIVVLIVGYIIGTGGIVLFISVGAAMVRLVERLF
ncbi:MAG: exopolysaccharide biosynthesis protein [Actinomycetota bacterium]|nr:exopolysaccharide biosynthesis protein [Actinomycetota bacterium]